MRNDTASLNEMIRTLNDGRWAWPTPCPVSGT